MSESNLNLDLNVNTQPSPSVSGSTSTTQVALEPVEEEEEEDPKPEHRQIIPSFPLLTPFIPLDFRKYRQQRSNSAASFTSKSISSTRRISTEAFKFMLSDTNPLCSQLYLDYANYQGNLGRFNSSNSDSSLENWTVGKDGKSEKFETQGQRNNWLNKTARNAERYEECHMSVREIQMRAHNISLQTKVKALDEEKSRLIQLLNVRSPQT